MLPPIPLGTVLRQRYVIQQVLGQGGFGRTYLALDQERFNESCVLKEFSVPYQEDALVEKSKTLFQREANTLYQIQHPQVPRFWAAFEDEKRLFLVQSFIEGNTYRRLLSDRKQQGKAFSEAEVLHLLNYLLPVLTYIHDREIIHRDISPENIVLQTSAASQNERESFPAAGLPVLIDFGAVKEAASHWPHMASQVTRVGKVGYAPPEQLQTGKVYPNSDLYALAATSLALLTGREPRTLLDSQTLVWNWQPHAELSERLGTILRKMLAIYPGDRYQSAREVWADLQPLVASVSGTVLNSSLQREAVEPITQGRSPQSHPPTPITSRMTSLFKPSENATQPRSQVNRSPQRRNSLRLWPVVRLGVAMTCLVGLGVAIPLLWRAWTSPPDPAGEVWIAGAKVPQSEASRIIESQGANSSSAALKDPSRSSESSNSQNAAALSPAPQPIRFAPGEVSAVLRGTLQNTPTQAYSLRASQGQIMTATLAGKGVTMNLLRSNQKPIDPSSSRTQNWTGQLTHDDEYQIQVVGAGTYTLDIAITPLSRPRQEQIQRIGLTAGSTSTTVTGDLSPSQVIRYLLKAKQGQVLVVKAMQGAVRLNVIAPNGQRLGSTGATRKDWQGRLPTDGDYVIEVSASQAGAFMLSLELF